MSPIFTYAVQFLQAFGIYDAFVAFILAIFGLTVFFAVWNFISHRK